LGVDVPEDARDYTFQHDILHVEGVAPWGADLILAAEKLGVWERAGLASAAEAYDGAERSNDSMVIGAYAHPEMAEFEGLCQQAFHACVFAYKALCPFLPAKQDTGYQLLRYQPGQQFKEHIDAIPGHPSWGARVLSGVLFLNGNFEGGELAFPRQKQIIKPLAGDVVLFPSNFTHPHASRTVEKGVKYSVVCWFI